MADLCVIAVKLQTSLKVKIGGARGLQGPPCGEWDNEVTYQANSVVGRSGDVYLSKTDGNIGNDPATQAPEGDDWRLILRAKRGTVTGGNETVHTIIPAAGVGTIDPANGNTQILVMTEDLTLAFSGWEFGTKRDPVTLIVVQDSTGGWTLSIPVAVKTSEGAALDISVTADEDTEIEFWSGLSADTYRAAQVGKDWA